MEEDAAVVGPGRVSADVPNVLGRAPAPDHSGSRSLGSDFLRWAFFCVPLIYLFLPLSALIHEVVGHGLSGRLYGGEFRGFLVDPWGHGEAFVDAPGYEVPVLVAGSAAEALVALIALRISLRLSPGGLWRTALLLFVSMLLESVFLNVLLGGIAGAEGGDFSRIADLVGRPEYRARVALVGCVGFLGVAYVFARLIVREARAALGPAISSPGWRRLALVALLVLLPGLRWLLLLVGFRSSIFHPAICWPYLAAAAVHAVAGIPVVLLPDSGEFPGPSRSPGCIPIAVVWSLAATMLSLAHWWSRYGWWE